MGAGRVVVIDAIPERLALARQFGADEVIDFNDAFEQAEWAAGKGSVARTVVVP